MFTPRRSVTFLALFSCLCTASFGQFYYTNSNPLTLQQAYAYQSQLQQQQLSYQQLLQQNGYQQQLYQQLQQGSPLYNSYIGVNPYVAGTSSLAGLYANTGRVDV